MLFLAMKPSRKKTDISSAPLLLTWRIAWYQSYYAVNIENARIFDEMARILVFVFWPALAHQEEYFPGRLQRADGQLFRCITSLCDDILITALL